MFLLDKCSSPALMYFSLLLTTMVEFLSALLMTRSWLEESCVRASLLPLVRLCLKVRVSVIFAISFLLYMVAAKQHALSFNIISLKYQFLQCLKT